MVSNGTLALQRPNPVLWASTPGDYATLSKVHHIPDGTICIDNLPVEKHDLLILRIAGCRVGIKPETPERVVQQRTSDLDLRLAATHPVVERDDLCLSFRQGGVGPDLQRDLGMPVAIIVG